MTEGTDKKPLVFISHVADTDKSIATKFEDWIRVATKSQADVFVSSTDGITPGEFADMKIIQTLRDAHALIILLSPSAKNNAWLAFESGAFYGLGKPVIPIACRGAKPADFDGPLKQPQMADAADPIQFSAAIATLGEAIGIHFVRDYNELRNRLCEPMVLNPSCVPIVDGKISDEEKAIQAAKDFSEQIRKNQERKNKIESDFRTRLELVPGRAYYRDKVSGAIICPRCVANKNIPSPMAKEGDYYVCGACENMISC